MGLFGNLVYGSLHLVVMAIDLVAFFLIVRLLSKRWPFEALTAFDRAGASIVDGVQGAIGSRLGVASLKGSTKAVLSVLLLIALSAVRMVLVSIARGCSHLN